VKTTDSFLKCDVIPQIKSIVILELTRKGLHVQV